MVLRRDDHKLNIEKYNIIPYVKVEHTLLILRIGFLQPRFMVQATIFVF